MENRLFLVLTILVLSGLVKANDDRIKIDSTDKKNPIINLFEAPLKAFQTKPGEAIAVFQPEIVRQAEQGDNQNSSNSWFNAGQSIGSQVSSLTGWLTNRLYQQSSTTPKPDDDISIEVQQIKPNRNGNVNSGNGGNGGNGNNKPLRKIVRLRPLSNNARRRPLGPNNQNKIQFLPADLDEHLIDLAEQQRIDNERLDDDEEEYDDNLEELDDQDDEKPVRNKRRQLANRNQNVNFLRNGNRNSNMNRVQNNQNRIRNQNVIKRRPQQQLPQNQRQQQNKRRTQRIRNQNRRPMQQQQNNMQNNNNNKQMMKRPNANENKRGFNDNSRYSIDDDDDEDLDDDDYIDDDLYDDNKNSDSNDYSNSNDNDANSNNDNYNEDNYNTGSYNGGDYNVGNYNDGNYDDYNNVKDKIKDNEDEYDDGDYEDLQTYEPLNDRPQQSVNVASSGFRPLDMYAVGGNGHIDRIVQMNQRYPTNAMKRRQQLIQQQQEEHKKQEQEQQQLQQALLNQQHIIIPIHFIPDSIPYKEIAPQIVPQAQIQVVAQHHHTVENTANTPVVQQSQREKQGNKNRFQNNNRSQNNNNRRPANNMNHAMVSNNNKNSNNNNNQNKRKNKTNQRVTRTTTRKPQKNDDVFYSVSLIAPGPATANRNQNMKTTKPTRRPPTIRNIPRSSPTPNKQQQQQPIEDNFRGDLSGVSIGMMQQQDKNRPDATPQSSDEMHDEQQTPPQYVGPAGAPQISDMDDDDDDDQLKPQARTQFYLPQRYYQILGSDKYLAVSNKGRFLLKSARSLDLDNIKESDIEHPPKVIEKKPIEQSVLEPVKEVESTVKVPEVKVEDVKEKVLEVPELKVEEVKKEIEESTVKPQIVEEFKVEKEEVKPVLESVQPIDEHIKVETVDKEIDDGSWSTSTERPFVVKDQVEENKLSTIAPPLNKAGKVLLRSEIVQEKQNGGRFLVKSEQVKY